MRYHQLFRACNFVCGTHESFWNGVIMQQYYKTRVGWSLYILWLLWCASTKGCLYVSWANCAGSFTMPSTFPGMQFCMQYLWISLELVQIVSRYNVIRWHYDKTRAGWSLYILRLILMRMHPKVCSLGKVGRNFCNVINFFLAYSFVRRISSW